MNETQPPPWMRTFELVTGVFSILSLLSVFMIIIFHLAWRSACVSVGIC